MTTRQTSRDAYAKVDSGPLKERVFDALRAGPATREELADRTGIAVHVIPQRVLDLIRERRAHETGETRKTRAGRSASVIAIGPPPSTLDDLVLESLPVGSKDAVRPSELLVAIREANPTASEREVRDALMALQRAEKPVCERGGLWWFAARPADVDGMLERLVTKGERPDLIEAVRRCRDRLYEEAGIPVTDQMTLFDVSDGR